MNPRNSALCAAIAAPVLFWGIVSSFQIKNLSTRPALFWSLDFFGWVVLPGLSLLLIRKYCNLRPADFGLKPIHLGALGFADTLSFCVCTVAFLTAVPFENFVALIVKDTSDSFSYADVIPKGALAVPTIGYMAATASVVEEVFYRGILARLLISEKSSTVEKSAFVLISAVLFSVNHFAHGQVKVAATFYLGIVAALLFLRYRSLWPLIGGHLVLNLATA